MEAKTKRNLTIWGVILLVLLNVTSLATIWYHRYQYGNTRMDRRHEVRSLNQHKQVRAKRGSVRTLYMSRGLELNTSQQEKFDSIWNQYSAIRRDVEEEMVKNRREMSLIISEINIDTTKFNELSANQGILMQELDHSMITMNMALRTTLNDDQLKAFLAKVETMSNRMRSRGLDSGTKGEMREKMRKRTK